MCACSDQKGAGEPSTEPGRHWIMASVGPLVGRSGMSQGLQRVWGQGCGTRVELCISKGVEGSARGGGGRQNEDLNQEACALI